MYDNIFTPRAAFKNFSIVMHKLRDDEGSCYNRYRNRMNNIDESNKRKRAASQAKYRTKRKQRLNIDFCSIILSDYNIEDD